MVEARKPYSLYVCHVRSGRQFSEHAFKCFPAGILIIALLFNVLFNYVLTQIVIQDIGAILLNEPHALLRPSPWRQSVFSALLDGFFAGDFPVQIQLGRRSQRVS